MIAAAQLGAYGIGGALAGALDPRTVFVLAGSGGLIAAVTLARVVVRSPLAEPATRTPTTVSTM